MADGVRGQALRSESAGGTVVGKTVAGRYRIEAVVDESGETALYEARHEALGKRVALKWLHAGPERSKASAERFLARAKLAASIAGPHVNRISDFGKAAEGSYVVMDWLEGEPLSAWLGAGEAIPLEEVLGAVDQVGRALVAAHARGVVHGKLALRHLFRARQGDEPRVVVLGFGEEADPQGERARADVRALGGLLLEVVSSAKFDGVTTFAVRRQREPELDIALGQKVRKLPAALQAIVVKALALETTKGYRKIEDLCSDLDRFRTGEIPDALLEMIASGSWALIPEEKSAAAVEAVRAAAAKREAPKAEVTAPRAAVRKPRKVQHRQAALLLGLIAFGLLAGWVVSGWLEPSEEVVVATETARTAPRDLRAFGPDE